MSDFARQQSAFQRGILTGDNDFLGCGRATWTVETLIAELASG